MTAAARRRGRMVVAAVLAVTMLCGLITLIRHVEHVTKTWVVAYFDNSNLLFPGDDVRILGVPVGRVDKIEPEPTRAKVTFWVDSKYRIPADAKAVDPVSATGDWTRYSNHPRLPRGTGDADRRRHRHRPHRGPGGVG